ncbi:phosphotransferase [Roseibacillus persicicus]|uniref:phosphotransferase n=1 Tax=Roseibacillus persicicus TaxID=454148 RepID=UPI00280EA9D7|nr:phosphotransferase [Roseibacillus persicicus]MDQ8189208.1 phosphotransferase [Roseibacillus persicicus]
MTALSSFNSFILKRTGARAFAVVDVMQELWSGYGQILRLGLEGGELKTVVAKHIAPPAAGNHPRGWNTSLSHARKVRSYQVEDNWYGDYNPKHDPNCRTPAMLGSTCVGGHTLLLLEDLDAAGYPERLDSAGWGEVSLCLHWLAEFHSIHLSESPKSWPGLWEVGTYWHLDTRPDELAALQDDALRAAAPSIDERLREARFQTLVHGDAKLANFCFSKSSEQVAGLDFQYVGGGCGMKDVAYFLGSCLDEGTMERREDELLDSYFRFLTGALQRRRSGIDSAAVEAEWRELFPLAWTDFHRFLKGWCPTHWKLNHYSERTAAEVVGAMLAE